MPRGTKISVEVSEAVAALVLRGYGKAQIYRHLQNQKRNSTDRSPLPSKSSIDRLIDKLKPSDTSGSWSFTDADVDPDDARLVLDTLAAVVERTEGRVASLSRDLATWVVRIRHAAPSIPPWDSYVMATLFQNATSQGWATEFLELTLAFRPWESEAANSRFREHLPPATPGRVVALPNMISLGDGYDRLAVMVTDAAALNSQETASVKVLTAEDAFVLDPAVAVVPPTATATATGLPPRISVSVDVPVAKATAEGLAPTILAGGRPIETSAAASDTTPIPTPKPTDGRGQE
jgi:hypothetical protein